VVKDVPLSLPQGVLPVGGNITVRVTVTIRPISVTRAFDAAIEITGREAGLDYRLSISHAFATVGGPLADIDRINPAEFVVQAQVGGLGPGTHVVPLEANLPVGLSLVGTDPATVTITITASPSPSPSQSGSP